MGLFLTHALRGAQLLFALLVLGLGAAGCSFFNQLAYGYTPGQNAFIVFVAVWTLLVIGYHILAPRFFEAAAHPIIRLVADGVTMIFWFSGFIALAVLANAEGIVSRDWDYDLNLEGYGTDPTGFSQKIRQFYQVTAAAAAFGALEWILFLVTSVLTLLEVMKGNSARANHATANPEVQV